MALFPQRWAFRRRQRIHKSHHRHKHHTIWHREQQKRENQNVGARGGKETAGDEGGPGGDVSTDPVVSGDTSKTGYTSAVFPDTVGRYKHGQRSRRQQAPPESGSAKETPPHSPRCWTKQGNWAQMKNWLRNHPPTSPDPRYWNQQRSQ